MLMRYVIILLLGLLVGAGATVFFLGAPRAKSAPGARIEAPEAGGDPSGTVIVTLTNGFFDELLGTIFRDLGPPAFQLAGTELQPEFASMRRTAFQQGCTNTITLAPEGSNVKTQVQFSGGKVSVPLAFSGSYNLLGNCMQFKGWAQTTVQLRFDQGSQTVYGRLNVEGVDLEGVNPLANNFVTVFVRNAIDERVNPLVLMGASQLQLMIPVKASNGSLKAHVKEVRAEVLDGSLRMHISYEFSGMRGEVGTG
jgi:hypothetical protein